MTEPVRWADISHYQTVDLAAYKAAGYDRIAMKATGGALDGTLRFADPTFPPRWAQAGQLGLARVAYHFARNNNSGGDEFDWFLAQVQAAGGLGDRDVLCYDTEDSRSQVTISLARRRAAEFTGRAVARGHVHGWVYSGGWFLGPAGIVADTFPPGWRNLWISDYTPQTIELPPGWSRDQLVALQYTDHADLPGIPATDADVVLKEWIDVTSPSNWSPADRRVVQDMLRNIVDERMRGWAALLATGKPNSVTGAPADDGLVAQAQALAGALAGLPAATATEVARVVPAGGVVDYAALAAAVNDDAARRLEQ